MNTFFVSMLGILGVAEYVTMVQAPENALLLITVVYPCLAVFVIVLWVLSRKNEDDT